MVEKKREVFVIGKAAKTFSFVVFFLTGETYGYGAEQGYEGQKRAGGEG